MDGTNGPPGAMAALTNLIPAPTTDKAFQPRPASTQLATLIAQYPSAGFESASLVDGNTMYGMVATSGGHDSPFALDLPSGNFITIAGFTFANTPASPPETGDWTPPIMARIAERIIVTHPGFGSTFSTTVTANTTEGSTVVLAGPLAAGPAAGMTLSGLGLAGNTMAVSFADFYLFNSAATNSSNTLTSVPFAEDLFPGMSVSGPGIPANTLVVSVNVGASEVVMNRVATASASITAIFGGMQININQPANSTQTATTLTLSGMGGPFFGWFDISSFVDVTSGNTLLGSSIVTGNPSILGVQPGMLIAGPNITPGTSVVSIGNVVVDTTGDTHTNTTLDNLAQVISIYPGMTVQGLGIPVGTTVDSIVDDAVTLSQAATASAAGVAITFSGALIVISAPAIGTGSPTPITISGGTPAAPLWGSGNTTGFPLTDVPVSVAQMAGSAFYAVSNGVQISDPLLPCQISNASQALTFANGLPVTALGPLPLNSLLGGIVQAIIAFQGISAMQQITGAFATSNLAVNQLPVPTGTLSPLSIVPMTKGLAFISPEGLRIIDFACNVGDPIGDHGMGIAAPFIYALNPSRICAAANSDTLRISVINGDLINQPAQEWWFDLTRKIWTGPHSFPASLIQPWRHTFVMSGVGIDAIIWQSDATPNQATSFVENGVGLTWQYQTSLLPDDEAMAMVAVIETMIAMILTPGLYQFVAIDDRGHVIGQTTISATAGTTWGGFNWGQAPWGPGQGAGLKHGVYWQGPLVFSQAAIQVGAASALGQVIGNLYLRYQIKGYMLQDVA